MITLERPGLGESPNTTCPFGSLKKIVIIIGG